VLLVFMMALQDFRMINIGPRCFGALEGNGILSEYACVASLHHRFCVVPNQDYIVFLQRWSTSEATRLQYKFSVILAALGSSERYSKNINIK
jgi:hypothetical protein